MVVSPLLARTAADSAIAAAAVELSRKLFLEVHLKALINDKPVPMPRPETRASPSSAGTLLSTVMLLAIVVTTTWLRTGVAHDIVRPLSNVAEIPASPARSGVELIAGQVRG